MHPLIGDLSSLKDTELETKINDLTRKYFSSHNVEVQSQIIMVLDTYKEELANRRTAEYNKMMNNRDKGLDKLINVS
ncbi:hypothetical protein UFOVP181_247 [uncultured Caudovirales phage]|uniref:Uncharacterized protein n=1 Tax=uncultured Caudovirales phage TaxID=2100421 RepID=A0A6J5KVF5_9CAUD|nr:hypothetical protein UFOVP57_392 [uncultured Caudovirales phage]CAB5208921.1 hypothetical protein UFOVP181_247 [uncultured Caudovirales phage]